MGDHPSSINLRRQILLTDIFEPGVNVILYNPD